MTVKGAVRWFQNHLGFINRLPSWLNELLSGVLAVAIAYVMLVILGWLVSILAPVNLHVWTFPLAFFLSELYEHAFDPWEYNPEDVVERMRGIVLVMVIVILWHVL